MTYFASRKWTTAKSTRFGDQMYDSKFEASVAQELTFREAAGELESWEAQKTLDLIVFNKHGVSFKLGTYRIDFVAYRKDGVTEYIEAKGFSTPNWKWKWAIFESMMEGEPDVELRVIWQGKSSKRKITKVRV